MNKNEIRETVLEKRNNVERDEVIKKGNLVKEKLFSLEEFKKAKTIMCFVSYGKEIFTHHLIIDSFKDKTVVVPKVKDFEIIPCIIRNFGELNPGHYRILEPEKEERIDTEKIDLVLIPGIAFDNNFNRIGFGKGFYDRFLKTLNKDTLKIGLCMDFQIIDNIPASLHDVKVDMIVTEERVI